MNGNVFSQVLPTHALRGVYDIFWGDMRRVYQLLPSRLRVQIWLLFFGMLSTALLEVFAITLLAFLGMSVAAPQATAAHPVFSRLHRLFPGIADIYADPMLFVSLVSVGVWIVFLLKNAAQACVMWRISRLGEIMSLELGEQMLRRYLYSPYIWHIASDSARTATALGGRESLSNLLIQILNTHVYAITALTLFVTLLSATPGVILGAVLGTVALAVLMYAVLKRRMDTAGRLALESAQGQSKSMLSVVNGIRDVLIYRQQDVFLQAYTQACRKGSISRSVVAVTPPTPSWILEVVGIGVIPLSIWLLARQGSTDLGRVASIISLVMLTAWRILPMVNRVLSTLISIRGIRPRAMNCLEVFEEMRGLPGIDLVNPDPDYAFNRALELRGVCFRYPDKEDDALRDISLTIPKGGQVGIIGLSGAGKSTLAGILSGLMEPTAGHILVDGAPMGKAQAAAYMLRVGYVPQSPYLFAGSVADNVAFSQWGRQYDRERVLRACRMAALDIVESGAGINIRIRERGAGLSGGQAQRVSIARALFCEPEVLIFDEATSSLDQANEDAIMETIGTYRGTITCVVVAHRLSTLEKCDYIYWLDDGMLKAHGPTAEMLQKYRDYCAKKQDPAEHAPGLLS